MQKLQLILKSIWRKTVLAPTKVIVQSCSPIGISEESQQCKSPLDFFQLFFSDYLVCKIVSETNIYAHQKLVPLNLPSWKFMLCWAELFTEISLL